MCYVISLSISFCEVWLIHIRQNIGRKLTDGSSLRQAHAMCILSFFFSFLASVALWLDSNGLTGTIPTEIALMTDLASLSLTNSTLTGPIPTEIGALTQLRRVWLYNNKLTGNIPTELNKLPFLEVVELHSNELVGEMPSGVCEAVGQSDYEYKSLTSDCKSEVTCKTPSCCTECF